MGLSIQVTGLEEVREMLKQMPDEVAKKTMKTSINNAAKHVKAQTISTVQEKTTLKKKYANANIVIKPKATVRKLYSKVTITGRRIPLVGYQYKKTPKGMSARIFRSGGITLRPHSFLAEMKVGKSSHTGIFWRQKIGEGRLAGRLPIVELTDLSIPQLVGSDTVWFALSNEASRFLDKELEANLDANLAKLT